MLNILFIYFNHYHDSKTFGFIYFVGLKIHRKPLLYAAQRRVLGWPSQNKSGPSKVTRPEACGYAQKIALDNKQACQHKSMQYFECITQIQNFNFGG